MLSDAPPLREAGVAGYETATRLVTAPCRHAVEIRRPLANEIDRLLLLPEVRDRLAARGAEPVGGTPSGWTACPPTAERARRSEAVRLAGIEPE
jgi:tripartite-type tricarboxylate transporter receptor subunit TctC